MKSKCHPGYVGIDVSKDWLDIATESGYYRIDQDQIEIDHYIQSIIEPQKPVLCVVESTGGYERLIIDRLHAFGLQVHIAHPSRVRNFARAKGLLAKSDKLDAYVLSAYGKFVGEQSATLPKDEIQLQLRDLFARATQIKEMLFAEQCRLKGPVSTVVKADIKASVEFHKSRLKQVREQIQQIIKELPELDHQQKLLCSFKGVGKVMSQTLLANLSELGKLSAKKVSALVGVAPITQQSGRKSFGARIQRGRGPVRHTLYMAALVAIRYNTRIKTIYMRLIQAGKPFKVAIVARMRKILVTLNAMVRENKFYNCEIQNA